MNVVTPTILSSGQQMDATFELISIEIIKEVNRIPYAQLVLIDGDVARQTFSVSNSDFFEPGKEIEIKLRYEGMPAKEASVFKGVVTKQGVEATLQGSLLTVTLKDKAVKLTLGRKNAIYREKTDDKIIKEVVSNRGLKTGLVETSAVKHLELVQYDATDWDFILSRAELNGLLVSVDDGQLSLIKPLLDGDAEYTFEYGISEIYDFEIEADAVHQYADVQTIAWDVKKQTLSEAVSASPFTLTQGNLDGAQIAEAIGAETATVIHPVSLSSEELKPWSDGLLAHSRLAMIRGHLGVPGIGAIKPLNIIEVVGIGERFNGKTLVTGIRHLVSLNGWQTDVQFGLNPERFTERTDIAAPGAAGHLPPIHGLQIGVVDSFKEDPDKEFRVRVRLSGMETQMGTVWARLATPDAGSGRGYFFRPEPDDEVIVGFFNDDPRQAVILGAMYSSKNKPPADMAKLEEKNIAKGIVTKTGTTISFTDDTDSILLIKTPGENSITLDDAAQSILIQDQHGNAITMSKDGIGIMSDKDVIIEASGDVNIKGSQVDIK